MARSEEGIAALSYAVNTNELASRQAHLCIELTAFVTLPALRLTARGLVNIKERKIVSSFAD
jgi:adenine deaminase